MGAPWGHSAPMSPAPRRARSPERYALGAAVVAHALLFALVAPRAPSAAVQSAGNTGAPNETTEWIDVLRETSATSPTPGADGPSMERPAPPRLVVAARGAIAATSSTTGTGGVEGLAPAPPVARAVDSAGGGDWSLATTRPDMNLGAGRFTAPAAGTATEADPGAAATSGLGATNALLEGISAHDVAGGTSRGGPILAAVEEAAHRGDAPSVGVATFDITVSRSGAPHVTLVDSKDDAAGWTKLGAAIATSTAKRQATLHLPDHGDGLRVRIRVEAVDRLADGTDVSKYAHGAVNKTNVGGTLERTGRLEDLPHAEVSREGKVCNVHAGVNLLGPYIAGGCSPENTLPARRTVAARIVSETRL